MSQSAEPTSGEVTLLVAQLAKMRTGGEEIARMAEVLEVTTRKVHREWSIAQPCLRKDPA